MVSRQKSYSVYVLAFCIVSLLFLSSCSIEKRTIIFDDKQLSEGDNFVISEPIYPACTFRILEIRFDSIKVEYPDFLAGPPPNPGPCNPVLGKKYSMDIRSGTCISTNTCDGGQMICFNLTAARELTYSVTSFSDMPSSKIQ